MAVLEVGNKLAVYDEDTVLILQGRNQVRLHREDLLAKMREGTDDLTFRAHFWRSKIEFTLPELIKLVEWFDPGMRHV